MRMDQNQYDERIARARRKDAEMSLIETEAGLASPLQCDLRLHLSTAAEAFAAGVKCNDWDMVCEGIVLLQQAITRVLPARANGQPS